MKTINEEYHFNNRVTFNVLPTEHVDTLKTLATPSVRNVKVFRSPNGAVSVTNFLDGIPGQPLYILGNGNLTLVHGTKIKTSTGANKVLAANRLYLLVLIDNVWYEVAP